ncbi:MAG: phosphoenolpyruvate--protein phosphotransferase [Planctomycetota bacterium]|jgi:phosphotransferase system enzyme I (PtsI)|nr:phosphoenolpyruvate--protein phosphotransferase [Planctomycetota bacterium]
MEIIRGKGVCGGIAIGRLRFFEQRHRNITQWNVADEAAECGRFAEAHGRAIGQVALLQERALREVGEKEAAVFEIHRMMLEDEDYLDSIRNIIMTQSVNAEYAVSLTREEFARMFSEMDDPYMQGRAADVRDISDRLLDCLEGRETDLILGHEPVVVAAKDLTPSETIQLDKSRVLAFATCGGSGNSHTAILARTMGLPAVVGVGDVLTEAMDAKMVIVDGFSGAVYVEPDDATVAAMRKRQDEEKARQAMLDRYKGKPNRTLDGKEILVYANIGSVSELELVKRYDAGGIGLFRSEFLFLDSADFPGEEVQFAAYRKVAKEMGGKRSIIRTLDIGADKRIGYFNLDHEENPALGLRGLRLCLERSDVFKTQLRALLRASAFGNIAVMFPMVASLWEVREAMGLVKSVQDELRHEGRDFNGDMEIGVMIETPAAAIISDQLAREVDFLSIGTNDLTQYTLAVDRQNSSLDRYCDPHHDAVLRLVELIVNNAHNNEAWVGVCGELAGDLDVTKTLLRMGVDELSVSPPKVLELRKTICELSLA